MEKSFKCIATGSSGNCYLINLGGGYIILDAGIPIKKIINSVNLNDVLFTCISHEHNDHKLSMYELQKRWVKILYGGADKEIHQYKIKNHKITTIPIEHGDTINSAFIIEYQDECILYATDFNLCEYDLSKYKFTRLIVECNYIEDLIDPIDIKAKRQINTHMGLNGLITFIDKLDITHVQEIDLIHISQQYGNSATSGTVIYDKYQIKTGVCKKLGGVSYYGRR